jgi:hypothetical protein
MTAAEIIELAKKRGVALEVFLDKLVVSADCEPDEVLVCLLRDNKPAVVEAILAAETLSERWLRILAERTEIVVKRRGLPRPDAEREAFRHLMIEYASETHPNTNPTRCSHCGHPQALGAPLLPTGWAPAILGCIRPVGTPGADDAKPKSPQNSPKSASSNRIRPQEQARQNDRHHRTRSRGNPCAAAPATRLFGRQDQQVSALALRGARRSHLVGFA